MGSWNHLRAGEPLLFEDRLPADLGQVGDKQEQAPELGAELARRQVQLLHVSHGRSIRVRMLGPLLIGPPGQPGKAFLLEDDANVGRAEVMSLVLEQALNVVDGEVLLASLGDPLADRIGFGGLLGTFGRGEEKRPARVLAEVADQDAKAARGVTEPLCGLLGGKVIDEVGAERLVLTVGGVSRLEESLSQVS